METVDERHPKPNVVGFAGSHVPTRDKTILVRQKNGGQYDEPSVVLFVIVWRGIKGNRANQAFSKHASQKKSICMQPEFLVSERIDKVIATQFVKFGTRFLT